MTQTASREFSLLADSHYEGLLAYVRARVGSAALAADIVQESWLRALIAHEKRQILDGRGYIFRVARNIIVDHFRHERMRQAILVAGDLPLEIACDRPSPERELLGKDALDRVMQLVVTLPPKAQAVFVMRKFDGLDQAEIARRLGIRRGTVEKHLRVALARLLVKMDSVD